METLVRVIIILVEHYVEVHPGLMAPKIRWLMTLGLSFSRFEGFSHCVDVVVLNGSSTHFIKPV
jgi:hypothetical protein